MNAIDRKLFVPTEAASEAYADHPLVIGYGATISAPHMHAHCLEFLKDHIKPGATVLDVGSGSGYLAAVIAQMVGPSGRVVGIEHIDKLVAWSIENTANSAVSNMLVTSHNPDGHLLLIEGDGREGYPPHAPYDAIHVGAAAPQTPNALLEQLKPGGRLVIPVGTHSQDLMIYDKKSDGNIESRSAMGVRYVPLTSVDYQIQNAR